MLNWWRFAFNTLQPLLLALAASAKECGVALEASWTSAALLTTPYLRRMQRTANRAFRDRQVNIVHVEDSSLFHFNAGHDNF